MGSSGIVDLHAEVWAAGGGRGTTRSRQRWRGVVKHAIEEAPRLSTERPDLSAFDEVIARMLAKDPHSRYASCDALIASIDTALQAFDDRPTLSPPAMPPACLPTKPSDDLADAVRILVVDFSGALRLIQSRRFLRSTSWRWQAPTAAG